MKYLILTTFILISTLAFAQPNREELALIDEEQFVFSFQFQNGEETPFSVVFSRNNNVDYVSISDDCQSNGMAYQRPIADKFTYDQFLNYLQEISITSFQPTSNNIDEEATLRVQASISISRTWTINAFVFVHNPDNSGEENQMLEYVATILSDNASSDCSIKFAEKISTYINGE